MPYGRGRGYTINIIKIKRTKSQILVKNNFTQVKNDAHI